MPITISDLQVAQVLKGSVRLAQTISVSQLGGTLRGQRVRERGTPLLGEFARSVPTASFLLALASHDGPFDVLNPEMGIYGVDHAEALLRLDPSSHTVSPATSEQGRGVLTVAQVRAMV